MNGIPITVSQALRVALVFVALIAVFGILSILTGWPDKQGWSVVVILSFIVATFPFWRPLLKFLRESGAIVEVAGVKVDFSKSCQINATPSPEDRQSLRSQIPLTPSCSPMR
jgi:hypothetical protein